MKNKTLLLAMSFLLLIYNSNAQGTATWNGSVSAEWNNAANWTWTNGSGLPGEGDDVIIPVSGNTPKIYTNTTASCRNLKLGTTSGTYVTLAMMDSSVLNVYGNISVGYYGKITSLSFEDKSTTLNLLGIGDQQLNQDEITIGNINVNKPSGDVVLSTEESYIYIANSLNFQSQPVAVGSDPAGNIFMDAVSIVFYADNPNAKMTTSVYQDNQTPPHLITNSIYSEIYFLKDFTGDKLIPVSPYITSYNPISIHSVSESWVFQVGASPVDACDSFYNVDSAVRRTWMISPTTDMNLKGTSDYPAKVSMTFQVNNVGRDVPANFNPNNNKLDIWSRNRTTQCWNNISKVPMPTTGYVTVTTPSINRLWMFAVAPDTVTPPPVITAINSVNAMRGIVIFPNPATDYLTLNLNAYKKNILHISIVDVLGKEIFNSDLKDVQHLNSYNIDLQNFTVGLYSIRMTDDVTTESRKFVKQ